MHVVNFGGALGRRDISAGEREMILRREEGPTSHGIAADVMADAALVTSDDDEWVGGNAMPDGNSSSNGSDGDNVEESVGVGDTNIEM